MRAVAILASDEAFFDQTRACIRSIRAVGATIDLILVDLGLAAESRAWLDGAKVARCAPDARVPRFKDAPAHTYALTCRPYIPDVHPGYDIYTWIDSDLRFLTAEALATYLALAARADRSIAICQETEPTYRFIRHAKTAELWMADRARRLVQAYGVEIARRQLAMAPYNAGLFAARVDSPIWVAYRARLASTLTLPFDRMREQDALNVAIRDVGGVARLPATMNWICSMSMPWRAPDGSWRHPVHRESPIHVLHLTQSGAVVPGDGGSELLADLYRREGLPV